MTNHSNDLNVKQIIFTPNQRDNKNNKRPEKTDINIYPNPSSGLFTIETPEGLKDFYIEVTDMNNQLVLSIDNSQFDGMIDLSNFTSGTYIISIISEKQLITSKMVVKM